VTWAVFLDRDGTIIHDRRYLSDPRGVEPLPGATDGLAALRKLGARLVVISNQSGVGRGYFTIDDVARVNARMSEILRRQGVTLDAIYVCPHAPDEGCDCRKPQPGLIIRAATELGIDLGASFIVGDREVDVAAGHAAGVIPIAIGDETTATLVAGDLLHAAFIVASQKKGTAS
jgi:histidinol-phosphate phosphatase family protein